MGGMIIMTEEETYTEMIKKPYLHEMPERLIKQSFEALEHNYDISQRAKMEAMHNAIVQVINEQQARPEHALFALEIVKSEIVNNCRSMFFAPPQPTQVTKTEPESIVDDNTDGSMEEDSLE